MAAVMSGGNCTRHTVGTTEPYSTGATPTSVAMPNVVWVRGNDFGDVGWTFCEVSDEGDKVHQGGADLTFFVQADLDGIAFHRVVQWCKERLGSWEDDGGVSEFANNLLENLDSNGTLAENAFEFLGDTVGFDLGKLNGAAGSVYEETEEFLSW